MPSSQKLASAGGCALRVRTAFRKDGAAWGGWHGERPHRETRETRIKTVTVVTTASVDLGKGRRRCDLRTFPMCRHPVQLPGLGCGSPFHLSTAYRGHWAGPPCESHSASRAGWVCLFMPTPGHPASIGLSLLEVIGDGRDHPTAPTGSRKEAGVWYSAEFRPAQLLLPLGSLSSGRALTDSEF